MGEIKALSWNEQLELFKSRGMIVNLIELVKQINPKYKWQDIQNSIYNLCKENEERANLLGFNSVISANNIVSEIKKLS